MKRKLLTSLIFIVSLLTLPVRAAEVGESEQNIQEAQRSEAKSVILVSRREASDLARENFEGRVLNIRLEGNIWRVRMDREGTVFNVFVDSSSSAVSDSDPHE